MWGAMSEPNSLRPKPKCLTLPSISLQKSSAHVQPGNLEEKYQDQQELGYRLTIMELLLSFQFSQGLLQAADDALGWSEVKPLTKLCTINLQAKPPEM